jgi:hypothetical protein
MVKTPEKAKAEKEGKPGVGPSSGHLDRSLDVRQLEKGIG